MPRKKSPVTGDRSRDPPTSSAVPYPLRQPRPQNVVLGGKIVSVTFWNINVVCIVPGIRMFKIVYRRRSQIWSLRKSVWWGSPCSNRTGWRAEITRLLVASRNKFSGSLVGSKHQAMTLTPIVPCKELWLVTMRQFKLQFALQFMFSPSIPSIFTTYHIIFDMHADWHTQHN